MTAIHASEPLAAPAGASSSAHIGRHFGAEDGLVPRGGRLTLVSLDRRSAEEGIESDTCLQCGIGRVQRPTRFRFTQLPGALLSLLPLAVPMPVLFPLFLTALVLGKNQTRVGLPVCPHCTSEHRRGLWLRRVTSFATVATAVSVLPLIVLTRENHVAVALAWLSVMAGSLGSLLAALRHTRGRVLLCEEIAPDRVSFLAGPRWRELCDAAEEMTATAR